MPQTKINPWKWQDQYCFSQAIEVSSARRLLFCAGQLAVNAEGKVVCAGDMRGQLEAAMNNVETVLAAAGLSLAHVVRLNFYTTDVDGLFAHYDVIASRLAAVGCQPSSTLLGVNRLAFPESLIEIEATATE
jgi:2-iminobutanoate/2-iminopropanoate deaminase